MHIDAHLDLDVVAVQEADQVTLMLELLAPEEPTGTPRAPACVEVVLDRSGSMHGERIEAARSALLALVDRLDPRDAFGLVVFDDDVEVVVPAGPLTDKPAVRAVIAAVQPGSTTNLSGGLLRGVQEARRVAGPAGATLLLVSDGLANEGVVDPAGLEAIAAGAQRGGVTVSTIGLGLGYSEEVLAAVARGGQGNHVFAEEADAAGPAMAGEVDGLLSRTVQAASLLIRPTGDVGTVTIFNDLPSHGVQDSVMVELGDLWAGESRTLLVGLGVPAMAELGLAQIAWLELRYVTLPALAEETVTMPVSVNVVPGDQAAGRIPNPKVRNELLFQQAQEAKRHAAEAITRGDDRAAYDLLTRAGGSLEGVDAEEQAIVLDLAADVASAATARAAKRSHMEHHRKSRKRGRGA